MKPVFSDDPVNPTGFTARFNRFYNLSAGLYDVLVQCLPAWRRSIESVLPFVEGPQILEVSFGTGHLLTRLPAGVELSGIDLNHELIQVAVKKVRASQMRLNIQQADVYHIPYPNHCFQTVINTMALSGYPDGFAAIRELLRVLAPGGRLLLVDVNYPRDRNLIGMLLAHLWRISGDLIRDMDQVFSSFPLTVNEIEVGGCGSVHLYVCTKHKPAECSSFSRFQSQA